MNGIPSCKGHIAWDGQDSLFLDVSVWIFSGIILFCSIRKQNNTDFLLQTRDSATEEMLIPWINNPKEFKEDVLNPLCLTNTINISYDTLNSYILP